MGKVVHQWKNYQNLEWTELLTLVLGMFEFHTGFVRFEMSLRELLPRLKKSKTPERNLAAVIDAIVRYHAEVHGLECVRWADKTPAHSLAMDEILQVFPDALFIHMLRDGVDSVASGKENKLYDNLEFASQRWKSYVTAIGDFTARHSDRVHVVRYEELARTPEAVVPGVCQFLGLPYDPTMLDDTAQLGKINDVLTQDHHQNISKPINTSSIGRGRTRLSPDDLKLVQSVIGQDLKKWGYAPADEIAEAKL